ncbi:MAG: sigma-E processing peptidase SpoIIGA [Clostridia bacterium]|nr:sigma-E processing peptidase SpoIIGA [Clostridia bacterium]
METTVYADVLFFVNFSMDFITLWIAALISSREKKALRMSAAAAVGGLYGVLNVILSPGTVITYICAGAISALMCLIAFGTCSSPVSFIKQSAVIWICGALLGGLMTSILSLGGNYYGITSHSQGSFSLICALSIGALYMAARIICSVKDKRSVTVSASWKGRTVSFSALCDSGNLMRDPLGGSPVIPVSSEIIEKLCGRGITEALINMESDKLCSDNIRLRIIPSKAISASGMICGFIPDSVTVISGKRKKKVSCVLAVKDCKKDFFGGNSACIPYSLLP